MQCTAGQKASESHGHCGAEATHVVLVDRNAFTQVPYARRFCERCAREVAYLEWSLGAASTVMVASIEEVEAAERRER